MPPGVADVADVLVLAVVEVAEHPLQQHVGEPDHRVERRAQLMRHAGQELRLVPAGDLELAAPHLQLPEHPRVVDGDRRLARERLEQLRGPVREGAGRLPPDDQRADDLLLPEQRNREQRAPSAANELVEVRIGRLEREIRGLLRLAARGGATDERVVDVDAGRLQCGDQRRIGPDAGTQLEAPIRLVVLEDRATLGPRELRRLRDDRVEDLVEVETRRDGLADLAERAQLLRGAGELLEQLDVLDRDRRLRGERRQELDRPVAERIDLEPPERQHPDDPVADQHRRAEHGPVSTELAPDRPLVDRVGQHVRDVDDVPLQDDAADQRLRTVLHRMPPHVFAIVRRAAEDEGDPVDVTVRPVHVAAVGMGQPHGLAHDRLEDRLEPEVRTPDDLEDLAGGGLLLVRLGEVPRELSDAVPACDRRFRLSRHGMVPSWLAADLRRRDRTGRSRRPHGENPSPQQPVAAPRPADARRGCVHFCDRLHRNPPRRANSGLIIMRASITPSTVAGPLAML